jgi:phosphatidylserine/phosphatidylglycerophosphate/cardiolipin synthase-like enzyme
MSSAPSQADAGALDAASAIRRALSDTQVQVLVKLLRETDFAPPTPIQLASLQLSPGQQHAVESAIREAGPTNALLGLTVGLLALLSTNSRPALELCWTGPKHRLPLRSTAPAIEQLLLEAKRSILIATYDINSWDGPVLKILERRLKEGIEVKLFVDKVERKPGFLAWAKRLDGAIEVWNRPLDTGDPNSAFHVKCVIVDSSVGIFGSANLTKNAFRGNIELGLLVRDPGVVGRAEDVLLALCRELPRVVP